MGPDFLDRQCLWYMLCCNLISVLFLIQNSFSSRISGKRNRISGWPDIRGNPILIHIYCGRIDWFSWYLIRRISFVAGGRSPAQRQGGGGRIPRKFLEFITHKKNIFKPFMHFAIRSIIHSCIYFSIQSFIHWIIHWFIHPFIYLSITSFFFPSICPFIYPVNHFLIHLILNSFYNSRWRARSPPPQRRKRRLSWLERWPCSILFHMRVVSL